MSGFINERNDVIDNAVFDALQAIADEEVEWDMEIIGEVADFAERMLAENKVKTCRPWYDIPEIEHKEDETPCYKTEERCEFCTH